MWLKCAGLHPQADALHRGVHPRMQLLQSVYFPAETGPYHLRPAPAPPVPECPQTAYGQSERRGARRLFSKRVNQRLSHALCYLAKECHCDVQRVRCHPAHCFICIALPELPNRRFEFCLDTRWRENGDNRSKGGRGGRVCRHAREAPTLLKNSSALCCSTRSISSDVSPA